MSQGHPPRRNNPSPSLCILESSCLDLYPVQQPLACTVALCPQENTASGGRETKLLPPQASPQECTGPATPVSPHRAQMCSQRSPIRPRTINTEGRETIQRPRRWDQTSARWETQASWEIPIPPARSRAPCRAPVWEEPLTRTPALSRGQSYLMSQLSLPRSAGR